MGRIAAVLLIVASLAACSTKGSEETPKSSPPPSPAAVTPEQARAIAKEAYIYGFPIVDNYRVQYAYFVNKENPEYKGGWNEIHNTARVFTPEDKAIQTPNSDTPYSAVGCRPAYRTVGADCPADRAGSVLLIAVRRRLHLQLRTTSAAAPPATVAGKYLLAGPNWKGDKPEGVNEVIRSDTELALVLYRTQLFGPSDLDSVKKIQAGYQVQPLSAYLNQPPPAARPAHRLRTAADPGPAEDVTAVLPDPRLRAAVRTRRCPPKRTCVPASRRSESVPKAIFEADKLTPEMRSADRGWDGRCLERAQHLQEGQGRHRRSRLGAVLRHGRGPEGQLPVPDGRRGVRHLRQHRRGGDLPELRQRLHGRAAHRCEQLHLPLRDQDSCRRSTRSGR